VAWLFLGAGNILGGRWAYVELGWGGYWAWDPVENAAFMPWLASTAFVHSVMMQERKGMLKVWNMVLVILTFLLTIFGTFITRSGLISSVHSFAQSPIGFHFATFLVVCLVVSFGLVIYRLPRLKSDNRLDAFISRESFFILNNLVLLVAALAVLWGTIFPMISEAVQGERITVGPPFFNKIMTPLGLLLLFLVGAGPLVPWKRSTPSSLRRIFGFPIIVTALAAAVLLVFHRDAWALAAQLLCVFVAVTIVQEFWRGARARQRTVGDSLPEAMLNLVLKNRRRYGGYIVHAGVVLIFLGFSGNAFNSQHEGRLEPGQSMEMNGDYTLTYLNLETSENPSIEQVGVNLLLSDGRKDLAVMFPQRNWYKKNEQLASEIAIYSTLKEDVYVVFAGFEGERISVTAYVNPLVQFFWIGGIVMVAGGVIAAIPFPGPRRRRRLAS
jgi:cytochrome c-type biogenesis protein CcmF